MYYIRKNPDGSSTYVLKHADYTGARIDGPSLQHWKYVKRERVNGKWRYYYKDGTPATAANTLYKTSQGLNKAVKAAPVKATNTLHKTAQAVEKVPEKARVAATNTLYKTAQIVDDAKKKVKYNSWLTKTTILGLLKSNKKKSK